MKRLAVLLLLPLLSFLLLRQDKLKVYLIGDSADSIPTRIGYGPFADNSNHWYYGFDSKNLINPLPDRPRYQPTELTAIGDNILLFQKTNGGWPKNYDVFAILTDAQKESVAAAKDETNTTFDNGPMPPLSICIAISTGTSARKGGLPGIIRTATRAAGLRNMTTTAPAQCRLPVCPGRIN